jgi:hypothetical protein
MPCRIWAAAAMQTTPSATVQVAGTAKALRFAERIPAKYLAKHPSAVGAEARAPRTRAHGQHSRGPRSDRRGCDVRDIGLRAHGRFTVGQDVNADGIDRRLLDPANRRVGQHEERYSCAGFSQSIARGGSSLFLQGKRGMIPRSQRVSHSAEVRSPHSYCACRSHQGRSAGQVGSARRASRLQRQSKSNRCQPSQRAAELNATGCEQASPSNGWARLLSLLCAPSPLCPS